MFHFTYVAQASPPRALTAFYRSGGESEKLAIISIASNLQLRYAAVVNYKSFISYAALYQRSTRNRGTE